MADYGFVHVEVELSQQEAAYGPPNLDPVYAELEDEINLPVSGEVKVELNRV